METNDKTNNANEHNMVKNPNCQEVDQLAIYKRGGGVELRTTEKQLQQSSQSGTATSQLKVRRPNHLATLPLTTTSSKIILIVNK